MDLRAQANEGAPRGTDDGGRTRPLPGFCPAAADGVLGFREGERDPNFGVGVLFYR